MKDIKAAARVTTTMTSILYIPSKSRKLEDILISDKVDISNEKDCQVSTLWLTPWITSNDMFENDLIIHT